MNNLNEIECGQACQNAIDMFYMGSGGLSLFPGALKRIIINEAWKRRETHGRIVELDSLRELITAKPIRGWGQSLDKVEALIRDDPEVLGLYREAMVEKRGRPEKNNNVILSSDEATASRQGNSRAYSIDRVKRECDRETIEQVLSGDLSPNAALVRAGIRENRQVFIPRDARKAAEKLVERFGVEFARELAEMVTEIAELTQARIG